MTAMHSTIALLTAAFLHAGPAEVGPKILRRPARSAGVAVLASAVLEEREAPRIQLPRDVETPQLPDLPPLDAKEEALSRIGQEWCANRTALGISAVEGDEPSACYRPSVLYLCT